MGSITDLLNSLQVYAAMIFYKFPKKTTFVSVFFLDIYKFKNVIQCSR